MDRYEEVIDFLYRQLPMFQVKGPGAYKPGLTTAHILDDAFDNPHRKFKVIHVGGTNGKGSTSHTIASVLQAAGYKVGLYTSPHLVDFRERIRVDGRMMDREAVVDFVERYREMNIDCSPSFFEFATIMAFDYFASQEVDIAVVEVGLGGKLDTTNIVNPILSIITNVSLDHVALLGDTHDQIAREKSGIMKKDVPVVIGESSGVRQVFEDEAAKVGVPIVFAEDNSIKFCTDSLGRYVYGTEPGEEPSILADLNGEYQPKNANTVMAALRLLKQMFLIPQQAIAEGFSHVCASTGLMGRWMTIETQPVRVIADTGHNIGAWRYLGPKLKEIADGIGRLRMVLGFVNDKDVDHIFDCLPNNGEYYFVTPSVERGRDSRTLLELAHQKGISSAEAYQTVKEGYEKAISASRDGDTVFVGGSTFVVADLLTEINAQQ